MKLTLVAVIILCGLCSFTAAKENYSIQQQRFRAYYQNYGSNYYGTSPKVSQYNYQPTWNNNNNNNQYHNRPAQNNNNNRMKQPHASSSRRRQYNKHIKAQRQAFPAKQGQKCGIYKPAIRNKVANGQSTQHYEWPWYVQVIVQTDVQAFCGGTLISDEYILTAAHCFDDIPQDQLAASTTILLRGIRLFNHRLNKYDSIEAKATAVVLNPEYVPTMSYDEAYSLGIEPGPRNDIALIKIAIERPEVIAQLMPACLPAMNYQLSIGSECKIMGHGFTDDKSEDSFSMPNMLQMADVTISDNAMCRAEVDSEAIKTKITEDTLCIRGPIHPCVGDSGGPLVCKGSEPNEIRGEEYDEYDYEYDGRVYDVDEEWYLMGVTSFAVSTDMNDKCGLFKSAIFGEVSSHRQWIWNVVGV